MNKLSIMQWQTYRAAFRIMWNMIFSPTSAWDSILSKPSYSMGWHLKHFALPLMVVIVFAHLLGYLALVITIDSYSIGYVLVKAIATFFDSFFTFYVTVLIVTEWTKKLNWPVNYNQLLLLNCYSLSAFWLGKTLSGILANYPTLGSFFIFLGITGIYPFIIGAEKINLIDPRRLSRLVAMNTAVFVLLYIFIRWVFSFPLQSLYYLHVFNQ